MPLILGLIGFIFAALVMFAWAAVWLVAALFWLAWPLVLLVFGAIAWRRQSRYWTQNRSSPARASTNSAQPFFKNSGNAAFDEYRADTLRRLDEEREKFRDFLERLRRSKDKEAFDSFMSERRRRGSEATQRVVA